MNGLQNMRINTAVVGLLAMLVLLLAATVGLGVVSNVKTDGYLGDIRRLNVDQVNLVARINNQQAFVRSKLQALVDDRMAHKDLPPTAIADANRTLETIASLVTQYQAAPKTPDQMQLAEPITHGANGLVKIIHGQVDALQQSNLDRFNALNNELVAPATQLHDGVLALMDHAQTHNAGIASDFARTRTLSVAAYTALGVLALLMVGLAYLGLRQLVVGPLSGAVKRLDAIAKANLSEHIGTRGDNEIGQLFRAMRNMQQSLGRIVGEVHAGASSINVGAGEIAKGNTDLAARTEQQAASLQETAASMEELTATVKQNADNARQASGLANDASTTAAHGGEVMDKVITTMRGIADSSKKVAEITGMIDSIAFQTNILALNASVEAARAGEQGRGFAVVAGEVRSLAGRSADAAREIKQLIESSGQQVGEGSQLVEQAGQTMHDVVAAVKRVNDIMDEISSASQEQSRGIEQVSEAVTQMDEVTQQNAALVEEMNSAAASLDEQARRLDAAVAVFQLADAATRPAVTAPTAPRATSTKRVARGVHASKATVQPRRPAAQSQAAVAEGNWEEF